MSIIHPSAIRLLLLVGLLLGLVAAEPATRVHLVLVGDSTVARQQGWGNACLARLMPGATGVNLGHNGASSKSFRTIGDWDRALREKPTHILIQFGHNDQPGKGPERETDPATTYRDNLMRFIDEARAAGAQPILVTSMVRRSFTGGRIDDTLLPYAEAVLAVAKLKQVPVVDLHARSLALVEGLGPDASEAFSPEPVEGRKDHTHLSAKGGTVMAGLVIDELRTALPALAICFRKE